MKTLIPKLVIGLICVLLCAVNSTPTISGNDDISDLSVPIKPKYAVLLQTSGDDLVGRMVKPYITRHLGKVGIEVKDKPSALDDFDYVLILMGGEEKRDTFKITAGFMVTQETMEGTMPDDLETIGLNIANQYVDFIEVFEKFKEKGKEIAQ